MHSFSYLITHIFVKDRKKLFWWWGHEIAVASYFWSLFFLNLNLNQSTIHWFLSLIWFDGINWFNSFSSKDPITGFILNRFVTRHLKLLLVLFKFNPASHQSSPSSLRFDWKSLYFPVSVRVKVHCHFRFEQITSCCCNYWLLTPDNDLLTTQIELSWH